MPEPDDFIRLEGDPGETNGLVIASRPAAPEYEAGRVGGEGHQAFELYFHLHAIETMLEHVRSVGDIEVGGLLVGEACRDETGPWVRIEACLPAHGAESRRLSLTFTHEAWDRMLAEKDQRYPAETVVGWYHTHPGLGVFLSSYDLFIHRSFFTRPTDIALVIDPRTFSWTPMIWDKEELAAARRFYLYAESESEYPRIMELLSTARASETPRDQ